MLEFLIRVHLNMFFVLVAAGSICAVWGLALLVMNRSRPGAATAPAAQPGAETPATEQAPAEEYSAPSGAKGETREAEEPTPAEVGAQSIQPSQAEGGQLAVQRASKNSAIPPIYRSALNVTGGLALIQAALGGILLILGARPNDSLHYVYGILVLVAVPVAYTYASGKIERSRRDLLFFVLAAVVVAAAAVRAYATGHP
jgi:hypothetical protein